MIAPRVEEGFAPGKVILLGEHAVVYGHPAVAASLNLGLRARCAWDPDGPLRLSVDAPDVGASAHDIPLRLAGPAVPEPLLGTVVEAVARCVLDRPEPSGAFSISLTSDLPPGRGMGSSAALAIATLKAVDGATGHPSGALAARANRIEEIFHGTPSGVDCAVIARGGVLQFTKGAPPTVTPIPLARPVWVALLDSGAPGSTLEQVAGVRARRDAAPRVIDALFEEIAGLTRAGIDALERGATAELGPLFDRCHAALAAVGVSTPDLDALVRLARAHGALGAKLTGAGGGGLVLALGDGPEGAQRVADGARAQGVRAWVAELGGQGG